MEDSAAKEVESPVVAATGPAVPCDAGRSESEIDRIERTLRGDLTLAELEELPPQLLAQVVERAVAERLDLEAKAVAAEAALAERRRRYCLVDPPVVSKRSPSDMDKRARRAAAKWAPQQRGVWSATRDDLGAGSGGGSDAGGARGGARRQLVYSTSSRSAELVEHAPPADEDGGELLPLHRVLSSALLLYRVCSLLPVKLEAGGWAPGRSAWRLELVHVDSGLALGFTETPGGEAAVKLPEVPQQHAQFEADVLELLTLLCDPIYPHPYDCTVAGSVA